MSSRTLFLILQDLAMNIRTTAVKQAKSFATSTDRMPLETKHWKAKPIVCVPIKKRAEGALSKRHVSDPAAHPAHSRAARPCPFRSRARNHAEPHPDTRPHADCRLMCRPCTRSASISGTCSGTGASRQGAANLVWGRMNTKAVLEDEICAHAARRVALPRPRLVQHRADRARHVSTRDARCRHSALFRVTVDKLVAHKAYELRRDLGARDALDRARLSAPRL